MDKFVLRTKIYEASLKDEKVIEARAKMEPTELRKFLTEYYKANGLMA